MTSQRDLLRGPGYREKMNNWDFEKSDPEPKTSPRKRNFQKQTRGKQSTPEDFWTSVDCKNSDSCWEWKLSKYPDGYGRLTYQGRETAAHRIAYALTYGPIPKGMEVCHKCDNKQCCNPYHLFLGTHADNMQDAKLKGRWVNAPQTGHPKLSKEKADAIRIRYLSGIVNKSELARLYGVSPRQIRDVLAGKCWK